MKDAADDGKPVPQNEKAEAPTPEEYMVGYAKPPKHSQYPKGNGPGKGRPKGAKNIKTIVNAALGAKITTKMNGKVKKMSKFEAALHQLANKAAAGDLKAIEKLIALQERYGPEEHSVAPTADETKADLEALKNYLAMQELGKNVSEEDDDDSA